MAFPRSRGQNVGSVFLAFLPYNLLSEHNSRFKGPRLLLQLLDQLAAEGWRYTAHIPNHLLGVDQHASAQLFLCLDQLGLQISHPAIKSCIHPGRSPADNRHIV
ncbi:hypothetical protein D3C73_1345250 [compost metagenome]